MKASHLVHFKLGSGPSCPPLWPGWLQHFSNQLPCFHTCSLPTLSSQNATVIFFFFSILSQTRVTALLKSYSRLSISSRVDAKFRKMAYMVPYGLGNITLLTSPAITSLLIHSSHSDLLATFRTCQESSYLMGFSLYSLCLKCSPFPRKLHGLLPHCLRSSSKSSFTQACPNYLILSYHCSLHVRKHSSYSCILYFSLL